MSQRPWFDRIAHDLRGPLTSLQTAAYLLRNDPGGANTVELADIVVRQGQRLGRMIEELDDWSRAEQQRLVDERVPVALAAVVDLALTGVPGCRVEPEYAPGAEALEVLGDEARLVQLLRTLVGHAQARDPGSRLTVERGDGHAIIVTHDHGAALDDGQLERLLTTSQHPAHDDGLGLRLLVAGAIAEAHGGALRAAHGTDGGLELRCTLPLA